MSQQLVEMPEIQQGLQHLIAKYPHIEQLCPDPLVSIERSIYDDPFRGLIRIVAGQQVSTKAADSIWQKMLIVLGENFSALDITQQNYDDLRGCGLSGRKVEYIQGLAQAITDGNLNFEEMSAANDEVVSDMITQMRGFGKWSADMFLMFSLGRGNIWAGGDLGVRLGLQIFLDQNERPDDAQMKEYGAIFAPYGTAASLLMWHIKHHEQK